MRFGNLLKKELKELLSLQAIIAMIFTCLMLICMGQFMGGVMEDAINNTQVYIANQDDSDFTAEMITALPEYGADPELIVLESDDYFSELKRLGLESIVIIPQGFGEAAKSGVKAEVKCVSIIDKGGMSASIKSISAASLTEAVSDYVSDYVQHEKIGLTDEQIQLISEPVTTVSYTAANGKTVEASADALSSMLMSQSMIAPLAVFFLIFMASQMIMTAISTEKIDKTLETLLSAPVSRLTVLMSKMTAALIVALLNSASMIIGFAFYMNGMMGSAVSDITSEASGTISVSDAMKALGLTLTGGQMALFALQLFLTIAIGLSVSLILGAMATDAKSVQTLMLPVMVFTMIPFFVTMFTDVNSLSIVPRVIMYIIPFTHTYTAMNNMMFGNTALVWGGLVYQLLFFAVCMYLAVKIFTTDLLFTMNLPIKASKKK